MEIFIRDSTRLEDLHIDENELVPSELKKERSTTVPVNYITISSLHKFIQAIKSDLETWNNAAF